MSKIGPMTDGEMPTGDVVFKSFGRYIRPHFGDNRVKLSRDGGAAEEVRYSR